MSTEILAASFDRDLIPKKVMIHHKHNRIRGRNKSTVKITSHKIWFKKLEQVNF